MMMSLTNKPTIGTLPDTFVSRVDVHREYGGLDDTPAGYTGVP